VRAGSSDERSHRARGSSRRLYLRADAGRHEDRRVYRVQRRTSWNLCRCWIAPGGAAHRATLSSFHQGPAPRNKGLRYPPDPPSVEEIMAVMRACGSRPEGVRLRAVIVVLGRAGLRISEVLALTASDLDRGRGAVPPGRAPRKCESDSPGIRAKRARADDRIAGELESMYGCERSTRARSSMLNAWSRPMMPGRAWTPTGLAARKVLSAAGCRAMPFMRRRQHIQVAVARPRSWPRSPWVTVSAMATGVGGMLDVRVWS
jgi:integrase